MYFGCISYSRVLLLQLYLALPLSSDVCFIAVVRYETDMYKYM